VGFLDGNNGLLREVLDQLDLFVAERPYLLAIYADRADKLVFFDHRNKEKGSRTADIGHCPHGLKAAKISRLFSEVGDVNELLRSRSTVEGPVGRRLNKRLAAHQFSIRGRNVMQSDSSKCAPLLKQHRTELGVTDPCRVFQHLLEHRLQLTR
jgi:hypothetical protein